MVVVNSETGQIISKQNLGAIDASKKVSGGPPKNGSSESTANLISAITPDIVSHLNSYGNIGPGDWQKIKVAALQGGMTTQEFNANFGSYADTNRGDFYTAYGFTNPHPTWEGNTYVGKDTRI
jgi:hypothetical protein